MARARGVGKKANRFVGQPDGSIEVISSSSVSRLYRTLQVDLKATPELTWQWRVDEPVPPTDLTRKGEDDTALTIYVGFPWDPDRASFTERLKRPLVEALAGEDAPGRVLAYVFGGKQRRGEVVASPHLGSAGFMRVLRPADSPTGAVVRGAGRPRQGLPAGIRRERAGPGAARHLGRHRQHQLEQPRLRQGVRVPRARRGAAADALAPVRNGIPRGSPRLTGWGTRREFYQKERTVAARSLRASMNLRVWRQSLERASRSGS